jgi:hypothetical protein
MSEDKNKINEEKKMNEDKNKINEEKNSNLIEIRENRFLNIIHKKKDEIKKTIFFIHGKLFQFIKN